MRDCTLWEKHTTRHIDETDVAAAEIEEVVLNERAGGNGMQTQSPSTNLKGSLKFQSISVVWDYKKGTRRSPTA